MKVKKFDASQRETIKEVLQYIRRYRLLLAMSIVLAAISVALTLYIPILVGRAVDCMVGIGDIDRVGIAENAVKIGVAAAAVALTQWLMTTIHNRITFEVVRDIRDEAYRKIGTLPLSFIDSHSHGEIVSRVIADADQFADGLLMGFSQLFTGVVTILGTLGFMLSIHPLITLVVVSLCRVLYRKTDLHDVPQAIGSPWGTDGVHQRDGQR